jgi:N-acetyl-beta-hexosaminidase
MTTTSLTRLLLLVGLAGAAAQPASRWEELGAAAQPLAAIAPTPTGESHVGLVASGEPVQLRFPVPPEPLLGYWLSLPNLVAFTGKGSSYQLVLRRDGPQGPVLYTGPVLRNGDEWNASNRAPVDISAQVSAADRERGTLDVYATGLVTDDGWTLYRHRPQQPVLAYAVVETEDMRRQVAAGKAMQARGVAILPVPQEIEFSAGTLVLPPGAAIVVAPGAPARVASAAQELRDLIAERTGVELVVVATAAAAPGIVLEIAALEPPAARVPSQGEGYGLSLATTGVTVTGRDAAGCFYGAMTVGQMAQPAPGGGVALPCGRIRDWPAFPQRLIQYDVARGQTIDVEYVKRMIRQLARAKINGLVFYLEDDFQFRQYPFLGRPGTFTHDKARELSGFARRYGVQLIPQFEAL